MSPDGHERLPLVPIHHRVKSDALCWICRSSSADSREHRFKSADVRRAYGAGPYSGQSRPLRVIDGTEHDICGPRSHELTFAKSMCATCNNARTSTADAAYDTLVTFVESHQNTVLAVGEIDFEDVYGDSWEPGATSLMRYFAKHIGCRLVEAEIPVPEPLRRFVNQETDHLDDVQIELQIRLDIVAMEAHNRVHGDETATFWAGDLNGTNSPSSGEISEIYGHLGYRWLRMAYLVNTGARSSMTRGAKVIVLQSEANIDPASVGTDCAECASAE